MATLQNLLDNLKNTRNTAKYEVTHTREQVAGMDKLISAMSAASASLNKLGDSVRTQAALNKTANKIGSASDVQKTIKAMLETQLASDKVEQERHNRFMAMAEDVVPHVTEEQLKAYQEQKSAYQYHQKMLKATLDIEKQKADAQKKAYDEMAERSIATYDAQKKAAEFALKDKYGTIGKAIGGLEGMAQNPLSKFLMQGLGRYVEEQKQEPQAKAIQSEYDTQVAGARALADKQKSLVDKDLEKKQAAIKEEFDVQAVREHIVDPGAVTDLFKARDERVAQIAQAAIAAEASLVPSANDIGTTVAVPTRNGVPTASMESTAVKRNKPTQVAEGDESPVATTESTKDAKGKKSGKKSSEAPDNIITLANSCESIATAVASLGGMVSPISDASHAIVELSRMVAPLVTSMGGGLSSIPIVGETSMPEATVEPPTKTSATEPSNIIPFPKSNGGGDTSPVSKVSSKAGFVNFSGIGKGIGALSKNFTKFLGPWGLVANAIMDLDRIVPVISGAGGAIMDLSKLLVPMITANSIEAVAATLQGFNALITFLDGCPILGSHWLENNQSTIDQKKSWYFENGEMQTLESRRRAIQALGTPIGNGVNTTSSNLGGVSVSAQTPGSYTNPVEERKIRQYQGGSVTSESKVEELAGALSELPGTLASIQQSVRTAATTPGTTPVLMSYPILSGYNV